MPSLLLTTNVKVADPKAFSLQLADFGAKTLQKPIKYISTAYTYNETLTFNGTFDPAFLLDINSLGNINPAANAAYSKALFEFIKENLGIPDDRGYIVFTDPGNANMGHVGTTFATIFGK